MATTVRRPSTAREALVAELLGEVAELLDRVESTTAKMNDARDALMEAAKDLSSRVEPFQAQLAAAGDQVKLHAVRYVGAKTAELAVDSLRQQKQAMTESARAIAATEIAKPMCELAGTLSNLVDRTQRPWETWLTHAATAAVSSVCSVWVASQFMGH
jgi:hypothetical protein